jgi:copper chaperone
MAEVQYKVAMTCGGCSKAIKTLVAKVDGVASVDASHDTKVVTVRTTSADATAPLVDAITAAIKKTGKEILEGPTTLPTATTLAAGVQAAAGAGAGAPAAKAPVV